jgi:hypothetical protein
MNLICATYAVVQDPYQEGFGDSTHVRKQILDKVGQKTEGSMIYFLLQ